MNEITEAVKTSGKPPKLTVRGSVLVYTQETEFREIVNLGGFNPTICLLLLPIVIKEGPMKGYSRSFSHEEEGDHVSQYSEVNMIVREEEEGGKVLRSFYLHKEVTDG